MKITAKRQVTIPIEIRARIGLHPDTEVEFEVVGDAVQIRRAAAGRGQAIIRRMRGKATSAMSTEEILRLTRGR